MEGRWSDSAGRVRSPGPAVRDRLWGKETVSHPRCYPVCHGVPVTGWPAAYVSVCLWFPEVTGWDPGTLSYYYAMIPGPMGSWLYEKIVGYDSLKRLSYDIGQHFLHVHWKGRSLHKFLGRSWQVATLVISSLVLEDPPRGVLENSGHRQRGRLSGALGGPCCFSCKGLKALVTHWP